MLTLANVSKSVGGEAHLSDISLELETGSLNVLLGPTLSGKTSLMRIMAGLDKPTSGHVVVDGEDVTGTPVQQRNVAMVYQQFINYPTLSVYENIASPLRIAGKSAADIDEEVHKAAALLQLTPYLDRQPLNLSGGQQQRTALARAIVKNADLVLLDEPLANLDYKLREELRAELPKIFAETGSVFVYATTEPSEALLLGGKTATLHQGAITQFGSTVDVYRAPVDVITAQTFSDPPLNLLEADARSGGFFIDSKPLMKTPGQLENGRYSLGFQPHHLSLEKTADSIELKAKVTVTEITGSESFVHLDYHGSDSGRDDWVMLLHGIHHFEVGEELTIHVDPANLLIFASDGRRVGSTFEEAA